MCDDFASLEQQPAKKAKTSAFENGQERTWLRVYETPPCQMLNGYGQAKHNTMSDAEVWECMVKPLKSGAKFMTEFASPEEERRGIAVNRYLKSLEDYLVYQSSSMGQKMNSFIIKEDVLKEFEKEIAFLMPSVKYCLAPKKVGKKAGAATLRSQTVSAQPVSDKTDEMLDKHAKVVFDWLDLKKPSRVRMMLQYQSSGGLPFVAQCHHRAAQCFRYFGAKHHGVNRDETHLSEWQRAVKARHSLGSSGMSASGEGDAGSADFGSMEDSPSQYTQDD